MCRTHEETSSMNELVKASEETAAIAKKLLDYITKNKSVAEHYRMVPQAVGVLPMNALKTG